MITFAHLYRNLYLKIFYPSAQPSGAHDWLEVLMCGRAELPNARDYNCDFQWVTNAAVEVTALEPKFSFPSVDRLVDALGTNESMNIIS